MAETRRRVTLNGAKSLRASLKALETRAPEHVRAALQDEADNILADLEPGLRRTSALYHATGPVDPEFAWMEFAVLESMKRRRGAKKR